MAAKPTPDEIANIVDAGTLAEWCGFSSTAPAPPTGHTGAALVSPLEAFHVGLGLGPTEHFRVIAALAPADYTAGIIGIRFNGAAPTLKERGAMQLFHQTARRLCLLEDWPSIAPPVVAPPSAPPIASGGKLLNSPTIQVGRVMDQKTGDEITYLAPDFVQAAYARYLRVMEVYPSPQTNVTPEQLACLDYMTKTHRVPYADFSVWQKYGTRCLRKHSFTGMMGQADGSYKTVELLGPASFEAWCESYDVLCTALLMLDVVRRPRLIAYRAHIQELSELHGTQGWALLYQADVRCRQEWMETIRSRLQLAHTTALALGTHTAFRTDAPWDSVWEEAVADWAFWKREFERPAGKLTNFLAGVEGDAPIAGQARGSSYYADTHQREQPQPRPKPQLPPPQKQLGGPSGGGRQWRTHNDDNPPKELCRGYQEGDCKIGQGAHGQCGRDKRLRHQCAICLAVRHGAYQCGQAGRGQNAAEKKGDRGRGNSGNDRQKKGGKNRKGN